MRAQVAQSQSSACSTSAMVVAENRATRSCSILQDLFHALVERLFDGTGRRLRGVINSKEVLAQCAIDIRQRDVARIARQPPTTA